MNARIALNPTCRPGDDRLLIEITIDQLHVADLTEVHEGDDGFALVVYPHPSGGPSSLPAFLWVEALNEAHRRLAILGPRR